MSKKKRRKLKLKDIASMNNAYAKKYEEYDAMTLEELKALFASKKIGGSYMRAMLEVVSKKQLAEAIEENRIAKIGSSDEQRDNSIQRASEIGTAQTSAVEGAE